jgi:hypothetical protein
LACGAAGTPPPYPRCAPTSITDDFCRIVSHRQRHPAAPLMRKTTELFWFEHFLFSFTFRGSNSNYDSRYRDRDRNRRESKEFDLDSDSDFDFDCTDVL